MKGYSKETPNAFDSVEDPNKVPGWPPVADAPQEASNAIPSAYPKPSSPPTINKPYAPAPAQPTPAPPPAPPVEPMELDAVGLYKDKGNDLKELPATTLSSSQAAADRMAMLKTRVNELQTIREGYWRKQGYAVAAGATTAVLSLGIGVVAAGAAGVHQRNKLEQVKKALRAVLVQVNLLRSRYGSDAVVQKAEANVRIMESVFSKDIHRDELSGDL